MKTMREMAAENRLVKLEGMREQVQDGSLVIRQMTKKERRRYPYVPPVGSSDGKKRPRSVL
jgi:hypothetical protein